VVVGDSYCGKTQLINRLANNSFSQVYMRTGFNKVEISDTGVNIIVWDTSGSASYSSLRPLVYRDCSVVVICYSGGLERVKYWAEEIRESTTAPLVLVHTKNDEDAEEDTESISEAIGAVDNVSTSAKTGENVEKVFKLCISAAASTVKSNLSVNNKKDKPKRPNSLSVAPLIPACGNSNVVSPGSSSVISPTHSLIPRRPLSSLSAQVLPSRLYRRSSARLSIHSKLTPVPIPLSPNMYSDTSSIVSPTESSASSIISSNISIPPFRNSKYLPLPSPSTSGSFSSSPTFSPTSFQSVSPPCTYRASHSRRENIKGQKKVKSRNEKIIEVEEPGEVLLSGCSIFSHGPKSDKTCKLNSYNTALLKARNKNGSMKERCSLM